MKMRIRLSLVFLPLLSVACGSSLIVYEHPKLPDESLADFEISSESPFTCGFNLYGNPITCQSPVVRKIDNNVGITGISQYEKTIVKSEIGKPFSIKFHATTGWQSGTATDCISIITFIPKYKHYKIIYTTNVSLTKLESCGTIVMESKSGQWIQLDDKLIATRHFSQPFLGDGAWASPLTEDDANRLGIK